MFWRRREVTIIAHSIAPVFISKFLIENNIKVKKIISVCGFNNYFGINEEYDSVNKTMYIDESKLSNLKKCCDNINSINLCKFRDADMILSISGELCEPYIVFDSIVFLCDKYKVCINKYTIIQRKVDLFEYYFDEGISIGKDELKMFLQHFLTAALGYCINVVIKSLNINIFNKYRRFICKL